MPAGIPLLQRYCRWSAGADRAAIAALRSSPARLAVNPTAAPLCRG